jgi:formiminotetrahydrofolate cyclodeaminase
MNSTFLHALSQPRPDPGGGAAAAHSAALALALVEKVVRLEQQRQSAEGNLSWDNLLERVHRVSAALERLQNEDIQAYFQLFQALGHSAPEKLAAALEEAIGCPLRMMQQTQEGLALLFQAGARCQLPLLADLLVATELLGAAFRGAYHIARANLLLMPTGSRRAIWAENLAHTLKAAEALLAQVSADLVDRQLCP